MVRLRAEKPLFTGEGYTALFTACEVFKNEQEATQGEMIAGFEVFHTTNKPRELAVRVESAFCLRGAGGVPRRAGVFCAFSKRGRGAAAGGLRLPVRGGRRPAGAAAL